MISRRKFLEYAGSIPLGATLVHPGRVGTGVGRPSPILYGPNLLSSPRDFSDAAWAPNSYDTTSYDSDIAPNGQLEADTLTDGSAAGLREARQDVAGVIDSSLRYAWSLFVKKTGADAHFKSFQVFFLGGTTKQSGIIVNTQTGAISASFGTESAEVEDYDANYWRLKGTAQPNAGNTDLRARVFSAYNTTGGANAENAATGGAVWWHAQVQTGSSVGPIIEP